MGYGEVFDDDGDGRGRVLRVKTKKLYIHHLWKGSVSVGSYLRLVFFFFVHIYPLHSTLLYLVSLSITSPLIFFSIDIPPIYPITPLLPTLFPPFLRYFHFQLVSSLPDHPFLPSRVDEMGVKGWVVSAGDIRYWRFGRCSSGTVCLCVS